MKRFLQDKLEMLSVEVDRKKIDQFNQFYDLIVEWNNVMNLTAITDYKDVVEKHFLDSLSIERILKLDDIKAVMDVGTGAGFPGMPLKIIYPELKITLLDSLNKRVKFLNEVIRQLELKNIDAIHGRAEDIGKNENYREKYDLCVSRAVANLATLSEYCMPFVRVGGVFVSYKSGDIDEEVLKSKKAISLFGGKIDEVVKFQLPGTDINRAFVKIKKIKGTPKKYPRKSGIPSKEPLYGEERSN
ncbi:16S rRNA (guanine(527)-N(7))-methyltransferase RsmG [Lachnospiraceae bacterium 48-42]